jgi:oligogalacturonide lyase
MYSTTVRSSGKIAACLILASGMMLAPAVYSQAQGSGAPAQLQPPPASWVDQSTGHRIIRISDQPGSRGLYFNETAFTPDGTQMVYAAPRNVYIYDFRSNASRLLVNGPVSEIVVSKSQQLVYFMKLGDQTVYVADVQTGELRAIAKLPGRANIATANADDTLLAGAFIEGPGAQYNDVVLPPGIRPSAAARMTQRLESKLPMVLFTLDLHSGTVKPILHTTDWLNHIQFSPTDPSLLMYCHEGAWEDVDRIWTIKSDGTNNQLIHTRTQNMEIAGHEFWDTDGKTIWYDLQVPRGKNFYLASYNTETGGRRRYQMDLNQWSVHFNGDLASGLFSGDGGSHYQAAGAPDGQWIELYHPQLNDSSNANGNSSIQAGIMQSEHLVDLSKHDYRLEPNVRFSPDHKYVVFTSNMFGPSYVFAVEVNAAKGYAASASKIHTFVPSSAAATPDTSATIQVVDHSGTPLANALVLIKFLDNGHPPQVYSTGQDGKLAPMDFYEGLYRITITCPNGGCGDTRREMFAAQLSGNVVIQAHASSATEQGAAASGVKTTIVVQNASHKALLGIPFLVRTADAAQEAWYTTDKSGSASVSLPADPSVVVIPYMRIPYVYKIASACGPSNDAGSDAIGCVQVGDSTVVALPQ